jgi:hypothetical protein
VTPRKTIKTKYYIPKETFFFAFLRALRGYQSFLFFYREERQVSPRKTIKTKYYIPKETFFFAFLRALRGYQSFLFFYREERQVSPRKTKILPSPVSLPFSPFPKT